MAVLGQYADQLETMSRQEVVEAVFTHLIEQGETSLVDQCCRYDGLGRCCAAAIFLPVEKYKLELEGTPWKDLAEEGTVSKNHKGLIAKLQKFHDEIAPEYWLKQAIRFCKLNDLDDSFLDQYK